YRKTEDADQLKDLLQASFQVGYTIEHESGRPVASGNVTRPVDVEDPQWKGLTPGYYKIRPQLGSERFSKGVKFQIDPGDNLAVNVFARDSDFVFQRDVWSKKWWNPPAKPHKETGNWTGAILQNSRTSKQRLQLMAVLEHVVDEEIVAGSDGTLQ